MVLFRLELNISFQEQNPLSKVAGIRSNRGPAGPHTILQNGYI